jgi:phenylacetate-CoA ligase
VPELPSPYTWLAARVLFPLHEWAKGHATVRVRRSLETSQWWSPARLAELQVVRLRRLLEAAGSSVPYYRRLFAELGFDPRVVRGTRDLARLPLLDKSAIRNHLDALRSSTAKALARSNTGGSTGEPLIFYLGRERVTHDVAAKWRATRWWGVDIGDPEVVVWGSPIELKAQDRVRRVRDRLLRTYLLPAFEMSPDKVDGFLAEIRRVRPRMLFGYPSAFAHIAERARARALAMDDLGIRVAFVTSERLYDHQRRTITEVFGCPVANGYGGRDAGFIAHECPAGGMHITAEDVVVEIVAPDGRVLGPGEAGEVVVTHLASREFPFIRYRTGDVAVLSDQACACGRGLPLLAEIQGRSTDFVVRPDGTVMHGLSLIYVVRDVPGVRQFKIVQESPSRVRVLLARDAGFPPDGEAGIREGIERRMGPGVAVTVEPVDALPPEASGKYRYVVSKVRAADPGAPAGGGG